jgi:hypothetical protein
MYISIDMDKMRFLHKHEDYRVVANLDFIRFKSKATNCGPIDWSGLFRHFTDQELALLYKHTTNSDHMPAIGDSLRMVLTELAERFPVTDADQVEADKQAEYLELKHKDGVEGYVYVRGSTVPRRTDDVLFPDPIPLSTEEAAAAVRKHTERARQRAIAAGKALAVANAVAATSSLTAAPAAPRAPAQRPRSGVCKQIWEVLDAERASVGEPPSRARIKELASQYGWNPNTASVQSAAWRKQNNLP